MHIASRILRAICICFGVNPRSESIEEGRNSVEIVREGPNIGWPGYGFGTRRGAVTHDDISPSAITFGRRWIWVHHIKDVGRRKTIVAEAKSLNLTGFLKSGYPGIIVIESCAEDCDEFVSWVKGNKSRPGGFGRNWGHHFRGHLDFDNSEDRKLGNLFRELDDLAVL